MSDQIFSVIVADDEQELREAVCSLIDWEAAGFRLAGSAGNGLDALQMVEQLQPDLLLTDIRMPFIPGTELARQVRELQPMIQVAFLSGYDDFAYARSAIESEVIAYLLKPISMAELTQALQEIHRKMEEKFRSYLPTEQRGDLPLALASLLLDSFPGNAQEDARRRLLADCGLELPDPCEMTVAVLSAPEQENLPQNYAQIAEKVLRETCVCRSIVSGNRILSLLVSEDHFPRLTEALDELYYVARRILGDSCRLGVSRIFEKLEKSAEACREAVEAARLAEGPGVARIDRAQAGMGRLVDRALQIIEQRYMEEGISLGSVSEELYVSPNYLSSNMKKYAGDTFINLLIRKRMEAAKNLLQMKNLRIGEVAQRCGYSDQHYFSFCFKKYYGVSPAKMRRDAASKPESGGSGKGM